MSINIYINNKYLTWYDNIITKARERIDLDGYTEKHHIVPRSCGGNNELDNLVQLTAREHFVVHWLLTKFTEGNMKRYMIYGFWMLCNGSGSDKRYRCSSRTYDVARTMHSRELSELHKGRKHTAEAKKKMRNAAKGRVVSDETRKKISDGMQKAIIERKLHVSSG